MPVSPLGLRTRRLHDPAAELARAIAAGQVLGLVSGAFEWGPRALGHRSLLAPTGPRTVRERINRQLKRREPFRPLAPALLAQDVPTYFEHPCDDMSPFMTGLNKVRADQRDALSAVLHADDSARIQSVEPARAPLLAEALTQLRAAGHPGVVVNTSLNVAGEPIVAGEVDALDLYQRIDLDALLIEDLWIERPR